MRIDPLPLPGAFRISSRPHRDERGWFARSYCESAFSAASLPTRFVQSSISYNEHRFTLRGLHWQCQPFAEDKLIRCTRGEVFDVMVDLRPDSSTCGQWYGEVLSPDSFVQLFIPKGFAHGFLTLREGSELLYQMTEVYSADHARGIRYDDPNLGIEWPAPPEIISEKDLALPYWADFMSQDHAEAEQDVLSEAPSQRAGDRS